MFVVQTMYHGTEAERDVLYEIMEARQEQMIDIAGLVNAEFWWDENDERPGFAMITKWDNMEVFETWFIDHHADNPHQKLRDAGLHFDKQVNSFILHERMEHVEAA